MLHLWNHRGEAIKEAIQLTVKVYLFWVQATDLQLSNDKEKQRKLKITSISHSICFNVTMNYLQYKQVNLTLISQFEYTYFHYDMMTRYIVKIICCCCQVASVVSDSLWSQRRQPTRLRHPWDSPGKNTGEGCHFLLQCMKVKSEREVIQSCPALSDPMDCSLPGSSVHGIFPARVLEWVSWIFSYTSWPTVINTMLNFHLTIQ